MRCHPTHTLNCSGSWTDAESSAAEAAALWREIVSGDEAKSLRCSIAEGMNALVVSRLGRHAEAAALLADALKRLGSDPDRWVADRSLVAQLLGDYVAVCAAKRNIGRPPPCGPSRTRSPCTEALAAGRRGSGLATSAGML